MVGVSTSTVSKYVNGTKRFSPDVELRLKHAIETLGYRSNPHARSMITGQTRALGVSVLDIRNPHFANLVKGANRIAQERGYTLLLLDTEERQEHERALLESLALRVDGMVVSSRMPDESLGWLRNLGKPVVLVSRSQGASMPAVGADGYLAAYLLTKHVLSIGHRRIAYLGYSKSRWNSERIRGIEEGLVEFELPLGIHDTFAPSSAAGERACPTIMLGPNRPDVVICYNDLVALGFIKEARRLGFQLPRDVAVAGFDNIPYGEYTVPALTTIDFQSEKMGELAMERLIGIISGDEADSSEFIKLEPHLIVRESTGSRSLT
uniref:LacI family DNA-binding transcriptional regulator n=1 Tax=Burkholderia arboris TaxID=488730 RepID=UPI003BEF0ECB